MDDEQHPVIPQQQGRSPSVFWTLQLGGWIAFTAAMSIGRIGEMSLATIAVLDWALAALGFIATLGLGRIYLRLQIRGDRLLRVVGVILLSSYVAALIWTAAYRLYQHYAAPALLRALSGEPLSFREGLGSLHSLLDNTVFHTFILIAWSMLYVGGEYYRAMQEERERRLRAEAHAHQAQLRALRYQLNPHFLFNTLNAVSTLVTEKRDREATAMIARLSEFLRLTMESDGAPEVPLAEELEFVQRYLEIEQVRFGERLHATVSVDDEVLSYPVPSLILQPLIENAMKHALSPREEGGRIAVEARREQRHLLLRVADDGPGLRDGARTGERGIGLANTRERLGELYGGASRMDLEETKGGGLSVSIRIPLRPALSPAVEGAA